jgi:hypothetical protein
MRRFATVSLVVFLSVALQSLISVDAVARIGIHQASVEWLGDYYGDGMSRWTFSLTADEPIEAIGDISFTNVHQVWPYPTQPTVYKDDFQSWQTGEEIDTHLLIPKDQIAYTTGAPLTETNDGSLASGAPTIGLGDLGATENGMIVLKPAHQSTNLTFLQAILYRWENLGNLNMKVQTAGETRQLSVLPYTLEGTCGPSCPVSYDFGQTRVGATATLSADIYQAGDCQEDHFDGSNLEDVSGPFTHDAAQVCFSPDDRGQFNCDAVVNWAGTITIPMSGAGVGPVFNASQAPSSTVDFGAVTSASYVDALLDISNITDDGELGNLTKLSVVAFIEGENPGAFQLPNLDSLELLVGQGDSLRVRFLADSLPNGTYDAQLVLQTDVGAACGAVSEGEMYCFGLSGTVIPEPSAFFSLIVLFAWTMWRRRR